MEGERAHYWVVRDSLPDWEGRYKSYDAAARLRLQASIFFIGAHGWDGSGSYAGYRGAPRVDRVGWDAIRGVHRVSRHGRREEVSAR